MNIEKVPALGPLFEWRTEATVTRRRALGHLSLSQAGQGILREVRSEDLEEVREGATWGPGERSSEEEGKLVQRPVCVCWGGGGMGCGVLASLSEMGIIGGL